MISTEELYRLYLEHPLVSTDSREVPPGSMFFALRGENFDGNAFATTALGKGASLAIVDDPSVPRGNSLIHVENVLKTLQDLALFHRKQLSIPVIAITGTNGKTTTKELAGSVLSQKFRTSVTKGNLNNHIGVPLTLLSIGPDTEIAIIEMGANHIGEIAFLCNIALPAYGIITNIGKAHLEGFGGFEGVIKTKTELYEHLRTNGGKAFINCDNRLLMDHADGLEIIGYGKGPLSQLQGKLLDTKGPFLSMLISFPTEELVINPKLYGDYNMENILAAACIGNHFNVSPESIKSGIEIYEPSNNRSQVVVTAKNTLILDAYNANPDSLRSAIQSFSASSYPSKAVIVGDMLELGKMSDVEHLEIMRLIGEADFNEVFLVGPIFTRLNTRREWICFQDSELARMWFDHHIIEGKTILIKGSRGIMLEKIADVL